MPLVEARDVSRVFPMPAGPVVALRNVSLAVDAGEYVAITGPSGCGKSTLLHLVGCVDTPSSGSLLFDRRDTSQLSEAERGRLRLTRIGFVFQRFFLLPMLTAAENVELPQAEAGATASARRARTRELLDYVGLADRAETSRESRVDGRSIVRCRFRHRRRFRGDRRRVARRWGRPRGG